nr:uncharacterized protein LOC109730084 isoform X2 [Microcebus murinus]
MATLSGQLRLGPTCWLAPCSSRIHIGLGIIHPSRLASCSHSSGAPGDSKSHGQWPNRIGEDTVLAPQCHSGILHTHPWGAAGGLEPTFLGPGGGWPCQAADISHIPPQDEQAESRRDDGRNSLTDTQLVLGGPRTDPALATMPLPQTEAWPAAVRSLCLAWDMGHAGVRQTETPSPRTSRNPS